MNKSSSEKMKGFSIASRNRMKLSRQEIERRKKQEEERKINEELEKFKNTFEGGRSNVKAFVRGEVVNADPKVKSTPNKMYLPPKGSLLDPPKQSRFSPLVKPAPEKPVIKKNQLKKKSVLESFKDEIKQMQIEREQRHAVKRALKEAQEAPQRKTRFEPIKDVNVLLPDIHSFPSLLADDLLDTSFKDDPKTTNLFLGNVNPTVDESKLCELFGKYGPLASVKIMWPRTDEEKARERNCAFVAYMTRKDADRALRHLQGRDYEGFEMKLGYGKCVPIPPQPIYVPPKMKLARMPPPQSGLPFNAQPLDPLKKSTNGMPPHFINKTDFDNTLVNSKVIVVTPTDRNLLQLVHRMVEFVVREGPMFEAIIMNRESNNPMYRFLFDNKSPIHVYYRWRIYSTLQVV